MKKLLLIIPVLLLTVSGCFGGEDTPAPTPGTPAAEGSHNYATSEYKLEIPNDWEVLTPLTFKSTMPPNTLVAFRSSGNHLNYTPNVVIIKNVLPQEVSSKDYGEALRKKLSAELAGYKEIGIEDTTMMIDGKEVTEKSDEYNAVFDDAFYMALLMQIMGDVMICSFMAGDTEKK